MIIITFDAFIDDAFWTFLFVLSKVCLTYWQCLLCLIENTENCFSNDFSNPISIIILEYVLNSVNQVRPKG